MFWRQQDSRPGWGLQPHTERRQSLCLLPGPRAAGELNSPQGSHRLCENSPETDIFRTELKDPAPRQLFQGTIPSKEPPASRHPDAPAARLRTGGEAGLGGCPPHPTVHVRAGAGKGEKPWMAFSVDSGHMLHQLQGEPSTYAKEPYIPNDPVYTRCLAY